MLVRVGDAKDVVENGMSVFEVAGTNVSIANTLGNLYAFDDKCTHSGCSLAKGKLDGTTVTCPCHGSQFVITTGAIIRGPAERPVRSRLVEVEGEGLLVGS